MKNSPKNLIFYQNLWNPRRTNDFCALSHVCLCLPKCFCSHSPHNFTLAFREPRKPLVYLYTATLALCLRFAIQYLRFVCACVLITFIIQQHRIRQQILSWFLNPPFAAHCSRAVYPYQKTINIPVPLAQNVWPHRRIMLVETIDR